MEVQDSKARLENTFLSSLHHPKTIMSQYKNDAQEIELLKNMLKYMILTRAFDRRSITLQRQGRMGTYASCEGQEAVHVGTASALQSQDWAVPSFREQGVYFTRGIDPMYMFLFFMGSEEGNKMDKKFRTLPYCVPCASQIPQAVGIAMASQIKHENSVTMVYFGDGSSSEGDFHEALNFAAVFNAPCVFVCQNNQWAISTPIAHQMRSTNIAEKALAYGFSGEQVDGNDVYAVYQASLKAVEKARQGGGPSLIEAITYRVGPHTSSDDPKRYRDEEQSKMWKSKDPIYRLEKHLLEMQHIDKNSLQEIEVKANEEVKNAALKALDICQSLQNEDMTRYLFHKEIQP